jgi:23S rRNA (guanosine2251-2'-O)-methyltransferase
MNEYIPGRNGVAEALKAGRSFIKLYVSEGKAEGSLKEILAKAKEAGIPLQRVPKKKLDEMYHGNHQGIIGAVAAYEYAQIEDMLAIAVSKREDPFLMMLSEVEDPHNLGAIMRTAEIAGVHGIIIPKNNSVGLNSTVAKIASGAAEYLPVARVSNLVQTAKELKEKGLWVFGGDMDGVSIWQQDMKGPMLLVIGGEDKGIARLLLKTCDFKVAIPMKGHVSSLNASVAAGVMVYEILRQRTGNTF